MEYTVLPLLGGLILYILITILVSLGGFKFKLRVLKLGELNQYNKTNNILTLEDNNSVLVWLKSSGNYLLKIEFDSKGDFVRINQQLDQTTSGVKGLIYGFILKFR